MHYIIMHLFMVQDHSRLTIGLKRNLINKIQKKTMSKESNVFIMDQKPAGRAILELICISNFEIFFLVSILMLCMEISSLSFKFI